MKKSILKITIIAFLTLNFNFQLQAQTLNDSLEIKNICLDYIEGWYTGNAERMENALHTDLVKRRITVLKQTGGNLFSGVSTTDLIEYTKAGFGKQRAEEGMTIEVDILHIFKGISSVKTVTKDFVDYIHLGKFNGEWKIINVLWEINE